MSLLSKFTKTAVTIADKVTMSAEKAANIAALISNGIEAQAERFATYSRASLKQTLIEDELERAALAKKLAEEGIDPKVIDEKMDALLGRKK